MDLILERIDRCFANPSWRLLYPEASITHLPRVFSDHCPILLELSKPPPASINRPFRFQTMWLHHPEFHDVVRGAWEQESILPSAIKLFTSRVTYWNKIVFGNLEEEATCQDQWDLKSTFKWAKPILGTIRTRSN